MKNIESEIIQRLQMLEEKFEYHPVLCRNRSLIFLAQSDTIHLLADKKPSWKRQTLGNLRTQNHGPIFTGRLVAEKIGLIY